MIDTLASVIQISLGLGGLIALIRGIRGPELSDRIIALDLILLLLAAGLAVEGIRDGSTTYVPAVVAVALIAFTGTVLVARFIEWRDG